MDSLERPALRKTFEQILVSRIRYRIHERNLNALIGIFGPTGTGKSYTALRIAELVDPSFTVDNVVFDVPSFRRLIGKAMPAGTAIVGDDFGVAANARTWQSDPNITLSKITQSFRWLRYCVIITVPDISFLDSQVRRLFHLALQTVGKPNRDKQAVKCEPRVIRRYMNSNVDYYAFPTVQAQDTGHRAGDMITKVLFYKPSDALVEAYEAKKQPIMQSFYQQDAEVDDRRRPEWFDTYVVRRWKAGESISALARDFKVNRKTMYRVLKRAGESPGDEPAT